MTPSTEEEEVAKQGILLKPGKDDLHEQRERHQKYEGFLTIGHKKKTKHVRLRLL